MYDIVFRKLLRFSNAEENFTNFIIDLIALSPSDRVQRIENVKGIPRSCTSCP